ncbi:MAG: RES family NAD+ phosphorylase [Prevotellaceae bacterium]|nr:RES family NAD+ phosphorylase [Prevotellaceae bacterium]
MTLTEFQCDLLKNAITLAIQHWQAQADEKKEGDAGAQATKWAISTKSVKQLQEILSNLENELNDAPDWIYALVIIFLQIVNSTFKDDAEIWEEFKSEISHNNRFFPKSKSICESLEFFSRQAVYTLPMGTSVFRARLIKSANELPQQTQSAFDLFEKCFIMEKRDDELIAKIESSNGFWGFDVAGSDAPPRDQVPAGRINPAGISYLYVAEEAHTAIVEARPSIKQMVSVAEIEIKKDLRLFDFCATLPDAENPESQMQKIFSVIAGQLSMPNYVGDTGYLATQYVSEYIKNLKDGFDGIRFSSSLHEGGFNIVLFDTSRDSETSEPRNYVVKNSSIHIVNGITIAEDRFFPFPE